MTEEEREKVVDILMGRMIASNVWGVEWSDDRVDRYKTYYLCSSSDEKLIAELLGVDYD